MSRRRFFVDRIERDRAALTGPDAHHLARVLRAEPGQRYEITDGASLCLAEIESADPRQVQFRVIELLDPGPPLPPIVVLAALIKFDRFEWMIEKVTELGVKAVVPVETARSETGLLRAAVKRVERWRKIARESSQQSRRVQIPEIREAVSLGAALREPYGMKIALDENAAGASLLQRAQAWDRQTEIAICIGPEGGWTDSERTAMRDSGWLPASLGPTIVRAETAGIAAAAILLQLTV
jgi:16S rRNA (uracil1498-N3)-methyltransferase